MKIAVVLLATVTTGLAQRALLVLMHYQNR
jgi:hypothetical protein